MTGWLRCGGQVALRLPEPAALDCLSRRNASACTRMARRPGLLRRRKGGTTPPSAPGLALDDVVGARFFISSCCSLRHLPRPSRGPCRNPMVPGVFRLQLGDHLAHVAGAEVAGPHRGSPGRSRPWPRPPPSGWVGELGDDRDLGALLRSEFRLFSVLEGFVIFSCRCFHHLGQDLQDLVVAGRPLARAAVDDVAVLDRRIYHPERRSCRRLLARLEGGLQRLAYLAVDSNLRSWSRLTLPS